MKFITRLKQRAKRLKSDARILVIAYKDIRTPTGAKLLIALAVGYLLSPIDLIPDFIPVLGLLDDLIIAPILISASLKLIPKSVLEEARESLKNNPAKLKKTNWLFASGIVLIWICTLYWIYKFYKRL
ncbi:MAG TPA: YkvA family protein [Segetibacter sp.]|nr:YkvA family protein [Segetibacter sp.]